MEGRAASAGIDVLGRGGGGLEEGGGVCPEGGGGGIGRGRVGGGGGEASEEVMIQCGWHRGGRRLTWWLFEINVVGRGCR